MQWANQNARGRTYTLYVVFRLKLEEQELTTIRLLGVDPTVPHDK